VSAATDPASDSANRTVVFTAEDGLDMEVTDVVVAAGAAQAAGEVTYSTVDAPRGFAVHEHAATTVDTDGLVKYAQRASVNVLRQGALLVRTEEAVAAGDDVYVRFAANGEGKTVIGACRNDSDSSTCVQFSGVKFEETTTAAGYALVVVNLP